MIPGALDTTLTKEMLHQGSALNSADSFYDFDAMIQEVGIGDPKLTANSSESEISCAKDEAGDSCSYQRSSAHHAGLQSDVESRAFQSIVAD